MIENFHHFAKAVHRRLTTLSKDELFVVDGVDLYTSYLLSFPEGTNPTFRVNTVHDCSCCRNFIRNMGGLVSLAGGVKQSIWALENLPEPYATVAAHMDQLVAQLPIKGVFRTKETRFGAEHTYDAENRRWDHFYGTVAARHRTAAPDEARGQLNTTAAVLERGLRELSMDAVTTVLDLINSNSLYRGEEHRRAVEEFATLMQGYRGTNQPELLVWGSIHSPAARFRNTVIGTLVQDISEGMDVERAVRAFETKVAPMNYKRPTAVITPRMVEMALEKLRELDLEGAVERRFAQLSDISVNDVLFVDNSVRDRMRDSGLRGLLMDAATQPARKPIRGATDVTIQDFVREILPTAKSVSLQLENPHTSHMVSLTAPVHANTGRLFKWRNDFAWSYVGEVADSIRQRVKRAGGNVEAALRVSLAWSNLDDLDLHADCPEGYIYYGNKLRILDVDMNAGHGTTREPVENLSWTHPRDGAYRIQVNQFSRRETRDVGFTLEVECGGEIRRWTYSPAVHGTVECLSFRVRGGQLVDLQTQTPHLEEGSASNEVWGVRTKTLVPVSTIMCSPNHWENSGGVGNQHWFFMLRDCVNPEPARGIYNEFLRGELEPHRKVFEVLGSRSKTPHTTNQLSGVGFSAARDHRVTLQVTTNSNTRAYNITF
jgi:hypothetical protein